MIPNGAIAHERLAIVDPESGEQPLCHLLSDGKHELTLAVNGEIYNHVALRGKLKRPGDLTTNSDNEVVLQMYVEAPPTTATAACDILVSELRGMYAFVIFDARTNTLLEHGHGSWMR